MSDTSSAEEYVSGKLSDEESARFEAEMIKRPELAADVDVRQRIKLGLSLLAERKELEPLLQPTPIRRPRFKLAIAASVLAVMAGSWFALRGEFGGPALYAADDSTPASAILLLVRERSDEVARVVASSGRVALRIVVAGVPNSIYDAKLLTEDGQSLAEIRGVSSGADRYVNLMLKPDGLQPGRLELVLTPRGGEPETFLLQYSPQQ